MRPLHDRMPVILAPGDWWAWLNGATAADQVQALVRPCPEAALAVYPVGKAVGSVRNEGAGPIAPLLSSREPQPTSMTTPLLINGLFHLHTVF